MNIKNVFACIRNIFNGNSQRLREENKALKEQIDLYEKLESKIKEQVLDLQKKLEDEEKLKKQISDLKYFIKEVMPEILTDKFQDKKAAYYTFLKVATRKNFKNKTTLKKDKEEPKSQNVQEPIDISAVV